MVSTPARMRKRGALPPTCQPGSTSSHWRTRSGARLPSPDVRRPVDGGQAMYKTEPVIADGGEVIIYAPHLTEFLFTHGHLIDEAGYHVRGTIL